MGKIIWLASYPKSGNTWLRIVLTNYLRNNPQPANINALERTPLACDRLLFDDVLGVEASDLTPAEIEAFRPMLYEQLVAETTAANAEPIFMKVHDAFTYTPQGIPLLSKTATKGAIYLIRNPLDVVVSYAHHNHQAIDQTIDWMGNPQARTGEQRQRLPIQLPQTLRSWSAHVQSWLTEPDLALHLMRYEEMLRDPVGTFGAALHFAGLPVEEIRLQRALHHATFAKLQQQEQTTGFKEKAAAATSFFRKGQSGDWRTVLTTEQVQRIVYDHGAVMRRFGYLSENGEIQA